MLSFETKLKMIRTTGVMSNAGSRPMRKKSGTVVATENVLSDDRPKSLWVMSSCKKAVRKIMLVKETEVRKRVVSSNCTGSGFVNIAEPYITDFGSITFTDIIGEVNHKTIERTLPEGEKIIMVTEFDCN